jgi:ABC-type Fe3+/spermidine/putrescine transport system ATPase subunit
MTPVIEARGVTKRFPGVVANDNVSLSLERGEILALLGENGAGKSTLMNIIYGLYQPDAGEILVNGTPTRFHDPHDAIHNGIGMVHQHFMLVPVMTVTENMMLGEERTTGSVVISGVAAIVLGAGIGFLLGGLLGAIYWAVAGGLFLALQLVKVRLPLTPVAFGVLGGVILGLIFLMACIGSVVWVDRQYALA